MALRFADDDPSLNPGQKHSDSQFNNLKKAESAGNSNLSGNDDSSNSVKNAEENPSGGWQNNVAGKSNAQQTVGRFGFLKKKGPMLTIILTLVGGGIGIGSLLSPAFIAQSILGNVIQKFNTQETSLTIRTNKIIASKMSGELTTGSCQFVKILCRFSIPSNRFLSQLEQNGIQALDKDGNLIVKNNILPNTRPTTYRYKNSAGEEIDVKAGDMYTKLTTDAEFRAALHNATKTRFMSLTDSVFNSIKARFGFNTNDKLKSADSEAKVTEDANTNSETKGAVKTATTEAEELASEEAAKDLIKNEADTSVKKLAKSGRASVVNLAAGAACLVTDVPGMIAKTARAFQMAQLIKYSMVFLSAFGAIKAGDATPQEMTAIGDTLTQVTNGKSAMDSFGMKYAISGSTTPLSTDNYKKFIPGGGTVSQAISKVSSITDSAPKKSVCNFATNPFTGAAVDIALADTGIGIPVAIINAGLGFALSYVIGVVIPPLINKAIALLPMKSILAFFYGDLTQNLAGADVGDALVSGSSHVMSQTANAGGNMPLTPTQAVAYDNLTNQVQLAYAEEDRATKNPLDASNPNTFLGSIVQQIVPYFSNSSLGLGSIVNTFASMNKMVIGSFGTAFQPLTAGAESTDPSQYQLCDDPVIKSSKVAAGPFCNIIYGVPAEYLDEDPLTVVKNLISSKDIDENTGEPIKNSKLETWLYICTDGKTDQLENCQITKDTAEYALYTIDHRIQTSLDGTISEGQN